jgi:hypothetical protein
VVAKQGSPFRLTRVKAGLGEAPEPERAALEGGTPKPHHLPPVRRQWWPAVTEAVTGVDGKPPAFPELERSGTWLR